MKRAALLLALALAADIASTTCNALGLTDAAYASEYIALALQASCLAITNRPNNDDNDHDSDEA